VDDALFAARIRPRLALNSNSLELAKRLAMTGDAIAFMPGFMVTTDVESGRLVTVSVAVEAFRSARTSVCVHRDRELSFAARAVLAMLSEKLSALRLTA
jgi:DNA-binding transcriptional LysR family regulator